MRHLAVVGGVALVSGVVVASAIYRRRAALRSRLSRWTEALELVKAFGDSSGLEAELSPGRSPLRNFALTSAVQALTDRRAAAAAQLGSAHAAALSPASLREASRYMRFASAAYGAALMALFGLLPPPTREQLELSVEAADRAGICTHTGIRTEDLLRLDTASLDVAGSSDCLRHFLAVDSAGGGAVVLALRGTASLSDVVHDAVAYSEPFCGG
ncbi:hypothetical protein EMIHUDRAFT_459552 [Emiliania huxleyi CCMP1516]|uniref:Uncharacterized protein n=2 Tax=Emiliania huxleyi TaxID=2903 RepID=A0A0D3IQ40_EMIH1|nr:hypothetical protein EMIHUDRAFT_459552 [Emiliania huxleyi CCMP1516]EOD13375.1 hypothetical protein EMIHUDRAFT_459552 [Emiliania huxleyi CCMP1516]|eukprot:XP_005765804.1 hypothetical protein EMIHUDRAFT_459552 [Emiliania huxleyi CCMP1516]